MTHTIFHLVLAVLLLTWGGRHHLPRPRGNGWSQTPHCIANGHLQTERENSTGWIPRRGNSTNLDEIIINIDGSGIYVKGNTYYAMKHYSKHISRGHQRFEVTNSGSTPNVRASGFINPTVSNAIRTCEEPS